MRKASLLIVLLLVSSLILPVVKADEKPGPWIKSYGGSGDDVISDVKVLSDGSIIAVGYTSSAGARGYDALVMKLNPDGSVAWAKTYGGSDWDGAYAVALAPNGDVIVAGYSQSFGTGGKDFWVLRLDSEGNVKWQKTYGGSYLDEADAVAVASNGDVIVAGYTYSFGAGNKDVWVLRLDSEGNVKWQKTYGGKYRDEAHAVALAPNGDIIVAGYTYSFGAGNYDVWVLRLDSNGNVKWQKTYGGSSDDEADAVAVASNGDVIVAGYTYSFGAGNGDVWVLRLDENGNVKWQKTYGGSDWDEADAVAIAPNGDIIVAGSTESFGAGDKDVWVLRLDENGNVKWQKTYGGSSDDEADAVALAPNGDIIVAGSTWSFDAGGWDAWVLRLPSDGGPPGCDFCGDSNAQVDNTDAVVENTNAIVKTSDAVVKISDAVVEPTNLKVKTQYSYQALVKLALDKAESTISTYKSQGVILTPAEELLNKAQEAVSSGDYVKAYDYANQTLQKAKEIKKQHDEAESKLDEASSTINSYKSQGVALPSAESLLGEAQEAFNSGNYTKVYEYANQAIQKADEIKNQYDKTKPKLDEAKSTITSYKSQGIILTSAENLLSEAETAFNSGNYTKAYNLSVQAEQKAQKIKDLHDKAESQLNDARSIITLYKSRGVILSPAENALNIAQEFFNSGDYTNAYIFAFQAKQTAEKIEDQYEKAKEAISKAEGFLSPIGEAKKAFQSGDYAKAYQLALQAKAEKEKRQQLFALGFIVLAALIGGSSYRVHRKRERERKLREINSIIERAEKAPVLEKIRLLKEAEKLAGPVGPEALGRVRKLLSPAMNEATETYNRIIREFDSALKGLDVKTAEAKLSEAKPYAEILGRKDFKRKGERLERLKKELKDLQRTERLVKRGNLKEAAPTLTQLSSSPFAGVRERAKALLGEVEGWLSKVIAKGDSLFSSGDYAGAIKAYESALPIAEALGKGDMVRSKIESSRRTLDELRKRKRLEELLKEINAALSRRDYPSLGNLLQEVGKIARETRETRKVKALREELSTRLDNLLSKGEELELSGDYGGALAAYTEALSLAEALGRKTDDIEAAVSRIEEGQKKALLKKSVRLDVPTEMAHRAETEVSILVTNRFSSDLTLTADLSENRDYFELSEEKVEFPHVKPGKTIGESVTVKPKFIGDFDFTVKIDSNFGSLTSRTPVKVVKTMRAVTGATPAPVTSTPVLNPVEALQELYTDFQYIGEGGFARVYKAKRKDGKIVALKLPKTLDPAVGRAFVREITNWLHLKHPNIVELHDVNVIPVPYLEMEYCESSLARLGKPLPVEEASLIVFNIAEGLKYAHSKGIIHRDLKPSNVLLKNGLPKISDWGLSKVLEESMSATTTASFTPYYAAPEQIDKKFGRTDERTDIYQLGVLFYELVTGRLPFEGSLSQVMMGIIRDKPVPPGQLNPEARKVEPIIMKMLAKKKEDRYASVVELQRDLAKVLNMTYAENLKKSKTIGDLRRAVYYLTELLLINMKTNNVSEAYKYAGDLAYYTSGELRDEVKKLAEQVKLRLEESLDIPPELVEKAEIIAHKIRLGFEGS